MGLQFSSCRRCAAASPDTAAMAVLPNGSLMKSSPPVTVVQQVLASNPGCFVCHSDSMCYDEPIPAMAPDDELHVGQIYFVLSVAKLRQPLSAHDMAALAVRASNAISKDREWKKRRAGTARVAPAIGNKLTSDRIIAGGERFKRPGGDGRTEKLGEGRKSKPLKSRLHRGASLRARSVYRSFRVRLSTIYEEIVLE